MLRFVAVLSLPEAQQRNAAQSRAQQKPTKQRVSTSQPRFSRRCFVRVSFGVCLRSYATTSTTRKAPSRELRNKRTKSRAVVASAVRVIRVLRRVRKVCLKRFLFFRPAVLIRSHFRFLSCLEFGLLRNILAASYSRLAIITFEAQTKSQIRARSNNCAEPAEKIALARKAEMQSSRAVCGFALTQQVCVARSSLFLRRAVVLCCVVFSSAARRVGLPQLRCSARV